MLRFGNTVRRVWPPARCLLCGVDLTYRHGKEVRRTDQPHLIAGYACAHHARSELEPVAQEAVRAARAGGHR